MNRVAVLTVLVISSAVANGHHSFSAEFDSEKQVTVTGAVSEVRYRNPHVQYFLDVDEDGEATRWIIAAHGLIVMKRNNVMADTVLVGDKITVSGYAGRNGAQKVYLETLDTPDGTHYEMYGEAVRRAGTVKASQTVSDPDSSLFADLMGDWAFDVDKEMPGAPLHLQFERDGENLRAILDNEVIDVVVGKDSFTMVLNRENLAQFPAKLRLTGKIVDGAIAGKIEMIVGFSNYAELDAESFSAIRTSSEFWQPKSPAQIAPIGNMTRWASLLPAGTDQHW